MVIQGREQQMNENIYWSIDFLKNYFNDVYIFVGYGYEAYFICENKPPQSSGEDIRCSGEKLIRATWCQCSETNSDL